jgi:hypothetical protein
MPWWKSVCAGKALDDLQEASKAVATQQRRFRIALCIKLRHNHREIGVYAGNA